MNVVARLIIGKNFPYPEQSMPLENRQNLDLRLADSVNDTISLFKDFSDLRMR